MEPSSKKQTDKPSNFVSNKDFNPGALLRLKSLPDDQTNFWTEIFQRELKDNLDANDMNDMDPRKTVSGRVSMFRGAGGSKADWGRSRRRASNRCRTMWKRSGKRLNPLIRSFTGSRIPTSPSTSNSPFAEIPRL